MSETPTPYSLKLRDPRWQKKRLEILERDNWQCQICSDEESNLQVHHRAYDKGIEPWDHLDDALVTLCEGCHAAEFDLGYAITNRLIKTLKMSGFFLNDLEILEKAFTNMARGVIPDVTADVIANALTSDEMMQLMWEDYLSKLTKRPKNAKG